MSLSEDGKATGMLGLLNSDSQTERLVAFLIFVSGSILPILCYGFGLEARC